MSGGQPTSGQQSEDWKKPFQSARLAVQRGDFDEVRNTLQALGFIFKQGKDANHWSYYHPALRSDSYFRYPRNLYRPHGKRRSNDRIAKHDQSQAKQMIDALQAAQEALLKADGGEDNDEGN